MAFDLEYIMVTCEHKLRDELISPSVERTDSFVEDGARYGEAVYGDAYGPDLYILQNTYGTLGQFIEDTTGELVAILPLQHTITHSPQLYFKLPFDYLRQSLPQFSNSTYQTVVHYGSGLYYGADEELYFGGPAYIDGIDGNDPTVIWYVTYEAGTIVVAGQTYNVPANSVVIKQFNNVYDWYLDYTTKTEECPLCGGSSVNNDLIFRKTGQLSLIYDIDKLAQLVMKAMITVKGKNAFFPNYGTQISSMIGQKNNNSFALRTQIVEQLEIIKQNQSYLNNSNPNLYGARELLDDILGIKMIPTADPRAVGLDITILNKALEQTGSKILRI